MKEEQRDLYILILNQLVHDGFISEATKLSESIMVPVPITSEATSKLLNIIQAYNGNPQLQQQFAQHQRMMIDGDGAGEDTDTQDRSNTLSDTQQPDQQLQQQIQSIPGLDLDINSNNNSNHNNGENNDSNNNNNGSNEVKANFITKFIATHKGACRTSKFSYDGKFVATGSSDTSIKLLDVEKMRNYNQAKNETTEDSAPLRPVIKNYYDHVSPVTDLDFHPTATILASCSKDCSIRFYDYSSNLKRSFKYIQDTHPVRTIHFHPCGDMMLAGTEHNMIRLYDVNTLQSFTARKVNEHHHSSINQVRYSLDGNIFASCSKDGTIKIWDAHNFSLINTIQAPHSGNEVATVQISRNQKYLLSSGCDANVKLWEISSGRIIYTINTGVNLSANNTNRISATFNYNEDLILTIDDQPSSLSIFNSRTGENIQKLPGHIQSIRYIASSPTENAVLTCSNDFRARFWTEDTFI